jgi:hypothetical protein
MTPRRIRTPGTRLSPTPSNINEPLLLALTKRQQNQMVMVNPLLSAMVYFV